MIIIRFRGGLGNQMFQRCFLAYLSRFSDDILADISEYNGISYHNGFELFDLFDDSFAVAKWHDVLFCKNAFHLPHRTVLGLHIDGAYGKIKSICNKSKMLTGAYLTEEEFKKLSDYEVADLCHSKKKIYLDGFWIQKQYYDSVDFSKMFVFSEKTVNDAIPYLKQIENCVSCSIHIRLGDYLNDPELSILGKKYFLTSINYMKERVPNIVFFVFSDDIEMAKKLLDTTDRMVFVDKANNQGSGCDMFLMSRCNHNIISNSTYSFWAAKLNSNIHKMVIAPKKLTRNRLFEAAIEEGWVTF